MYMYDRDVLSSRIKGIRTMRGLNQKELADKVGCTNKNISTYESGFRTPEYETLVKIAIALDCSTDYLLGVVNEINRFTGDVDGHHHELLIDMEEKDKPYSKEQFENLIRKLESIGIDVDKLMNQ